MTTATRWHRPLLAGTAIMVIIAVVALAGILVDPRMLTGVPIWAKPFKFAISIALYWFTLAWMLSVLPRPSRVRRGSATAVTVGLTAEMIIVVVQVVRGQTSHFNATTPFNAALWQAMGVSIGVLFAGAVVIAVSALRQPIADRVAAYGIRLGLGLSLLGMLAAVPMLVLPGDTPPHIAGAHTIGLPDGGPGLPLLGWSTVGGDLRVGHFLGLHGLQAMPLLAAALTALTGGRLSEVTRCRLLLVAAAGYALFTVSLTWQALRAQPLTHPDALTLAVWAGIAVLTGAGAALVLASGRRVAAWVG